MAEAHPSDNTLLNLTSDSETGVEYIETGKAPYYLEFRQLLYRLLLATKRANDLRVFDAGGLNIGVKAGKFWDGTTLRSYSGAGGVALADDKEHIYVYLDASGSLVTDEYTSWPAATVNHVRLADVTTSGGDITCLVDARDHHMFFAPGMVKVLQQPVVKVALEAHTSDDTLTEAESGSVHSNLGAGGTVTLTLPASASAGTMFTFAVQAAQELRVDPGTAAIRDDSGQTADKYKSASAIGGCLTLVADGNGDWAVVAKSGTWTEEA